jgi:cytosine/adenosine deaminase-related metal-dependent hydrolase
MKHKLLTTSLLLALASESFVNAYYVRSDMIVTMADGPESLVDGYMEVGDDGRIIRIEAGDPDASEVDELIDARGRIVMPGFLSGHNHLWQSAFRGLAGDKELYGWIEELHWTFGKFFDDGDMYSFTLHGALDQLSNGITSTLNHSQTIAPTYSNYIEQYTAEMDAGQHFIFSYALDRKEPDFAVRKAKLVDLIAANDAIAGPNPCLGFGLHGVGIYMGGEVLEQEVSVAKELDLDIQVHYLEEKAQSLESGQSKFAAMQAGGGVWDGLVYAHFIHVTDEILQASVAAGAKMIWNPLSNGRLASGLADVPHYIDEGLQVGMGVDGAASADIADPFQNMRMGMYALRMRDSDAEIMGSYEVLELHTLKTAEVLEVADQVGSLEPGKLADFLIIDPVSPVFDPYGTLVFATDVSHIDSVWVQGVKQVENGKPLLHDFAAVRADMNQRVARIVKAAAGTVPADHM